MKALTFIILLTFIVSCSKDGDTIEYSKDYCECITKRLDSGVGFPIKVCDTDSITAFKKKTYTGKQLMDMIGQSPCD